MAERRLLVDSGNSRIKWSWAEGDAIGEARVMQGNAESFSRACERDLPFRPERVLLSNVAGPEREADITGLCEKLWRLKPEVLRSVRRQAGVRNGYEDPSTLGVDRWLAIVGAANFHGKPVIVWDLGTATTLDAVDENGLHLGGLILPGPLTMLRSLGEHTHLPVPGSLSEGSGRQGEGHAAGAAGHTTAEAIARGVFLAQFGALDAFRRCAGGRTRTPPKLVVSGGAAEMLREFLAEEHVYDPLLVFRGMLTA